MERIKLFALSGSGENGRNCYCIDDGDGLVLLDCGVKREIAGEQVGFYPPLTKEIVSRIKVVFLSHCHEDHTAALPLLYHLGYTGEVFATRETIAATPAMLAKWIDYVEEKGGTLPFAKEMAKKVRFSPLPLGSSQICGIDTTAGLSGHVLGGVWYLFTIRGRRILYTGDITLQPSSLRMELPPNCDMAIVNCAYAGQVINQHRQYARLLELVSATVAAGGKVLLPLPPKGRGSDILKLVSDNIHNLPVFAEEQIVSNYLELQKESRWIAEADGDDITANITVVATPEQRRTALDQAGGAIYLATDGMLTAKDGLEYYRAMKGSAENLIIITGHAAAGSVGAGIFEEKFRKEQGVALRAERVICKVHMDEADVLQLQRQLAFQKVILFHAAGEKNLHLQQQLAEIGVEVAVGSLPLCIEG